MHTWACKKFKTPYDFPPPPPPVITRPWPSVFAQNIGYDVKYDREDGGPALIGSASPFGFFDITSLEKYRKIIILAKIIQE
jgi:hypothetical protein